MKMVFTGIRHFKH